MQIKDIGRRLVELRFRLRETKPMPAHATTRVIPIARSVSYDTKPVANRETK